MGGELRQAVRRRGSLLQTLRAVGWSFLGVRRLADHEQDLAELNPIQLIMVGVLTALLFIAALVFLVRWIVGSGVAGG